MAGSMGVVIAISVSGAGPMWGRISPAPIEAEQDRRTICGLLTAVGLTVRIVKARSGTNKSAPFKKYIEYREE